MQQGCPAAWKKFRGHIVNFLYKQCWTEAHALRTAHFVDDILAQVDVPCEKMGAQAEVIVVTACGVGVS